MIDLSGIKPISALAKSKKATGACLDCRWSTHHGNDLECRRFPPQLSIILVPGKVANHVKPESFTGYPVVQPDLWCGEFQATADVVPFGPRVGDGVVA